MTAYYLGIDLGTTQMKGALYNETGELLQVEKIVTSLETDSSGKAQQHLKEIISGIKTLFQRFAKTYPKEIAGISFSCAMHTLIVLDQDFTPLTEIYTFGDKEGQQSVLEAKNKGLDFFSITGVPQHAMAPLYKVKEWEKTRPTLRQQGKYYVGLKDYLWYLMTGKLQTDISTAAASGFLLGESQQWSKEILTWCHLTKANLPEVCPMTTLSSFEPDFLQPFENQPVLCLGGTDGVLANLGLQDDLNLPVLTVGTSGAIRQIADGFPKVLPEGIFCYPFSKIHYLIGGATSNGGVALAYGKELFYPKTAYDKAIKESLENPSKALSLFFPYLLGERAPLFDPSAIGGFLGIQVGQQPADLFDSVAVGTLMNLKIILEKVATTTEISQLKINGGFFATESLRQLASDILGVPLFYEEIPEVSALGSIKVLLKAMQKKLPETKVQGIWYTPKTKATAKYQKLFFLYEEILKQYQNLFPLLQQWFLLQDEKTIEI